jgi:uncharacterized protein (TIGR02678 family)
MTEPMNSLDPINDVDDPMAEWATEPVPASRRKAWRPEADAETAALLRHLNVNCWLVAGRDNERIAAARRNEDALRSTYGRLGWPIIIDRDMVRLRKSPPPRPADYAADGPPPLVCSWFFLLVAAAESLSPRVAIGALVNAARSVAVEVGLVPTNDMPERRAIVAALRMLDDRAVIERLDGDLDTYLQRDDAPVLLGIHHTRLVHIVANPGTLDPAADPHAWLAQVQRESEAARRMRRALVDDTCVHTVLLDDEEAAWLSQRVRGDDGAPLAAAFGLVLERRAEGAAFVVPDEAFRYPFELGPVPFPTPGTVGHAGLLLAEHADIHGTSTNAPGPGWRGLSDADVVAALTGFAAENTAGRGGWSAEYVSDPAALADAVESLLTAINVVRVTDSGERMWWFAPAAGRWAEEGSAPRKTGRHRKGPKAESTADPTSGAVMDGEI